MTFPTLRIPEIVSCSDELRVPLTQDDIKNPQPNVIRKVFELYLEMFLNLNISNLQQAPMEGLMMIEHPQLHEESVPALVANTAMGYMMSACGVTDFSIQDIISPESKRIRKLLSALINFAKFREMQMSSVDQLLEEREQLLQDHAELERVNAERTGTIDQIKAAREADAPKIAELEAHCEALSNQIAELNSKQAGIQAELRTMKDEITNTSDETAKIIFEIQTKQQANSELSSKIVQSPERIKKEIVEMNSSVEDERVNLVGAERRVRELTVRVEGMTLLESDVEKGIKGLTEVASEIERLKKANLEIDESKDAAATENVQLKEITALEQQLKRQIKMVSDRMMNLSSQYDMKQEAGSQSKQMAEKERNRLATEMEKAKAQTVHNQLTAVSTKEKLRALELQQKEEMSILRQEHSDLLKQIGKYHNELEAAMRAH